MTWINGRFKEDEQDNSKGWVSVDWEEVEGEGEVFTFKRHLDTTKAGIKNAFKTKANAEKDAYLAKQVKQDTIGTTITTFMNA